MARRWLRDFFYDGLHDDVHPGFTFAGYPASQIGLLPVLPYLDLLTFNPIDEVFAIEWV